MRLSARQRFLLLCFASAGHGSHSTYESRRGRVKRVVLLEEEEEDKKKVHPFPWWPPFFVVLSPSTSDDDDVSSSTNKVSNSADWCNQTTFLPRLLTDCYYHSDSGLRQKKKKREEVLVDMNCSRRRLIRYTMYTHCRPAAFFFLLKREREVRRCCLMGGRHEALAPAVSTE